MAIINFILLQCHSMKTIYIIFILIGAFRFPLYSEWEFSDLLESPYPPAPLLEQYHPLENTVVFTVDDIADLELGEEGSLRDISKNTIEEQLLN